MPETRYPSLPAVSIYPQVRTSWSASETGDIFYLSDHVFVPNVPIVLFSEYKIYLKNNRARQIESNVCVQGRWRNPWWCISDVISKIFSFVVTFNDACELSQSMGKTEFSSTAKTEQTLSHGYDNVNWLTSIYTGIG